MAGRAAFWWALAVVVAVGLAAVDAPAQDRGTKLRVGFVYVGAIGDHGWTYEHNRARLQVEAEFGDRVETIYVENVPEDKEKALAVIDALVANGVRLVFLTSFGYGPAAVEAAWRYPDVYFEHATGQWRADNLSVYSPRFYEGRYLIGEIAGQLSKTGRAGYVGSFPIPEVIRGINAFALGARSVNPKFKVEVGWVGSWFDPSKEAIVTRRLIKRGADVITSHTDSPAPMKVADDLGLVAFGQASDMIAFGPRSQATAIVNSWGPYCVDRVRAVLDGSWVSVQVWNGLGAGMVDMAPYTNIPDRVARRAASTKAEIVTGKRRVFAGPIQDRSGRVVVKEGRWLSDAALVEMGWYVKGIVGALPK
ncbi:MAG: BMP family ABC transporter substrate-binding protein [Defluviicoccus sp.]|nr:BMP family ABC transporter substrate-binding protein [Defluviicoccus sp.]MDE0382870.1 BMP family ABC transporter substrate-binding protein [Defluviicoccus sp.]